MVISILPVQVSLQDVRNKLIAAGECPSSDTADGSVQVDGEWREEEMSAAILDRCLRQICPNQ